MAPASTPSGALDRELRCLQPHSPQRRALQNLVSLEVMPVAGLDVPLTMCHQKAALRNKDIARSAGSPVRGEDRTGRAVRQ